MQRKRIDDLFNYALVLLGILSAAEFQYLISTESEKLFHYILRIHTIPFFLLIIFWLVKELYKDILTIYFDLILTEFLWNFWSFTLFFYLLFIYGAEPPMIYLLLLFAFLLIIMIVFAYMKASQTSFSKNIIKKFYKNPEWIVIRIFTFICAYMLLILIIIPP